MEEIRPEAAEENTLNITGNTAPDAAEESVRASADAAENIPSADENTIPADENAPPAAGFLKVIGILMIVIGAAALIVSIIAAFGIVLIAASARQSARTVEELGINSALLYAGGGCLLLNALAQFITGIVGCANAAKPGKAKACLAWGIISAVLCAAGQAAVIAGGGTFNAASLALGLVLPVLFIIGAAKNKR